MGPPDGLVFPYAKGSTFFPRFIPLSKALEKGSTYGLKEVDFEANGSIFVLKEVYFEAYGSGFVAKGSG